MLAPIVALAAALRALKAKALNSGALQAERISKGTFTVLGAFRLTASKPGGRLRRNKRPRQNWKGAIALVN